MAEDILISLVVFAAIFGIVWVVVSARNRERMAMIEKGVSPKDFLAERRPNSYGIVKWALLLAGLGFGLFIGSLLETYTSIPEEPAYDAIPWAPLSKPLAEAKVALHSTRPRPPRASSVSAACVAGESSRSPGDSSGGGDVRPAGRAGTPSQRSPGGTCVPGGSQESALSSASSPRLACALRPARVPTTAPAPSAS